MGFEDLPSVRMWTHEHTCILMVFKYKMWITNWMLLFCECVTTHMYQSIAWLLETFLFWSGVVCELQLASYGHKTVPQYATPSHSNQTLLWLSSTSSRRDMDSRIVSRLLSTMYRYVSSTCWNEFAGSFVCTYKFHYFSRSTWSTWRPLSPAENAIAYI